MDTVPSKKIQHPKQARLWSALGEGRVTPFPNISPAPTYQETLEEATGGQRNSTTYKHTDPMGKQAHTHMRAHAHGPAGPRIRTYTPKPLLGAHSGPRARTVSSSSIVCVICSEALRGLALLQKYMLSCIRPYPTSLIHTHGLNAESIPTP